ncbi:MAG: radical SAM protein [Pseudomonadota bacterium]
MDDLAKPPPLDRRCRELAFLTARTCNIACRHCGIDSSPRNAERMRREDLRSWLIEAATLPGFSKVTFTGGEPFLFQDLLEELIALATRLGLGTRVVTNGFWARDLDCGIETLGRMKAAGLGELNFSADRFHLEHMERQVIHHGLAAAERHGLTRILSYVTTSLQPPLDELAALYDLPREKLVDLHAALAAGGAKAFEGDHIFVACGGVVARGRIMQYPEDIRHLAFDQFPDLQPCTEVIHKPVVYPDGAFQACCSAGGMSATFAVGDVRGTDLATLFHRMEGQKRWQFINALGPKELYRIVRKARPDQPTASSFSSICDVCLQACGDLSAEEVEDIVERDMNLRSLISMGLLPAETACAASETLGRA